MKNKVLTLVLENYKNILIKIKKEKRESKQTVQTISSKKDIGYYLIV